MLTHSSAVVVLGLRGCSLPISLFVPRHLLEILSHSIADWLVWSGLPDNVVSFLPIFQRVCLKERERETLASNQSSCFSVSTHTHTSAVHTSPGQKCHPSSVWAGTHYITLQQTLLLCFKSEKVAVAFVSTHTHTHQHAKASDVSFFSFSSCSNDTTTTTSSARSHSSRHLSLSLKLVIGQ